MILDVFSSMTPQEVLDCTSGFKFSGEHSIAVLLGGFCKADELDALSHNYDATGVVAFKRAIKTLSARYSRVLLVLDYSDISQSDLSHAPRLISSQVSNHANVHVLQNRSIDLDGYQFWGTTLFSSFESLPRYVTERDVIDTLPKMRCFRRDVSLRDIQTYHYDALNRLDADRQMLTRLRRRNECVPKKLVILTPISPIESVVSRPFVANSLRDFIQYRTQDIGHWITAQALKIEDNLVHHTRVSGLRAFQCGTNAKARFRQFIFK